ncbi:transcriptional regulator, AraC family [Sporobacter termitidis DSM 10068]|uniref:Transcriptional regulator, AraC family n=1 Tax=Sporobacter termitidis DSM 10068 TaxID=1123282 RepID=A0A1M5YRQ1_9FIRM|nr:AraC family transcriptional regulator [Sporobacter termitidis]SHI14651.1 transcriptional regulator, AraC family [Sporobacter termitidis DSM 10068]
MGIGINQLVDYYGRAPVSFFNIFAPSIPPGGRQLDWQTSKNGAGLVFPLSGSSRYTLNGTPYLLEPGVVLHAGPDTPVSKEVLGDVYWQYALIHYQIPKEDAAGFPLYHEHFLINTGIDTKLVDLIGQLRQSCAAPDGMAALKSKVLFMSLIEEMLISAKRQLHDENAELMVQAVEYIRQNYADPISVEKIAAHFGVNRRRFAYLFERHTGMSPIVYLTACRIRRSKELLRTCACPIVQVAECVGYTDSFYFSRLFKKQTGVSPTEFRTRVRENPWGM